MKVELEDYPLPPSSPIFVLDSDPKPRRYLATVDGERFSVLISRDNVARDRDGPDRRWHISVAGERGVPAWNVLTAIVHELRPGVTFCIPMPPRSQWVNYNENVLHAWEIADEPLAAQWAYEGRIAADRPT